MLFCYSVIPTLTWISTFGGKFFSTSFFILLNRKGLRILCNCYIISVFLYSISKSVMFSLFLFKSNHSSKSSDELKTSGNKKFNKLHNSCRLFCNGVPVSNSLYLESSYLNFYEIWLSSFLILWASSIIKYSHLNLRRFDRHILKPSNVVTITSNFPGYN